MLDPAKEREMLHRRFGIAAGQPKPTLEPVKKELPPPPEPEPSRYRWVVPLVIGLTLGYWLSEQVGLTSQSTLIRLIPTAKVSVGALQRIVRIEGSISAKSSAAIVAPRLRGRGARQLMLIRLADAGSMVKKGDVVAEFDRENQLKAIDDQRARLIQSEAGIRKRGAQHSVALEAQQQEVRVAWATLEKSRLDLRTAEVKSEIEAQILKMRVEEAGVEVKQLEHELELLQVSQRSDRRALEIARDQVAIDMKRVEINAQRLILRSPIDGMVVMMSSSRGGGDFEQVATGAQLRPGSYFMQIVDLTAMVLDAGVNQVDSQLLKVGQKAVIRLDAYPGRTWPGRLVALGALASSSAGGGGHRRMSRGGGSNFVRQISAVLDVQASDRVIIPDLSANADVVLDTEQNVLLAPREAVNEENGRAGVYVRIGPGRFARREVQTGLSNNTHIAVLSGLEAGEEIALRRPSGSQTVSAGRHQSQRSALPTTYEQSRLGIILPPPVYPID